MSKADRDYPLTASSGALDEMRLVCVACLGGASHQYTQHGRSLWYSVFLLNT